MSTNGFPLALNNFLLLDFPLKITAVELSVFFLFHVLAWCTEKNIQTPLENMTLGQVDTNLRRFYAEARTKTGEMYGRSTLLGFRHSIERHLNLPPNNRNVKMSTDPRFQRSNQMLDAPTSAYEAQR
jgi:hypothetical protein